MNAMIAQSFGMNFTSAQSQKMLKIALVISTVLLCLTVALAYAAAQDAAFLSLYTFFSNAATGNLTRGICLIGGIIGAGTAAVNGKILLAATGIGIAIFGALSPTIIGTLFTGAVM